MRQGMIQELCNLLGSDYVITEPEKKQSYFYDEIERNVRPLADLNSVVVKPQTPEEISEILRISRQEGIPVVVRGGGTGLCGAAIPVKESLILSTERMNRIIEIDQRNMVAVLEGGVTLAALLEELDKHEGLGFPVHPGDEGAQIGGMVVTNAGGSRAVKHGVMRKHVMGIEVVLPTGEILKLGGKLVKDNAGYSLINLMIGSEGTLGIVTKVILKLYPEEKYTATIIASFENFDGASNMTLDLLRSGIVPLAVEYQDKHLFVGGAKVLGKRWQLEEGQADLMVILSEKSENAFYEACSKIHALCKENNALEVLYAEKKAEQAELLDIRGAHYEYIKNIIGHSFDMAVPVGSIPNFLRDLKQLAEEYNTTTNVTAHIADGNIHNDIILIDGKMPEYAEELKEKMYDLCRKYEGSLTGEHGIGKLRVKDLEGMKSPKEIELMKGIKRLFDPEGSLNPGTVLDMD